jgi:hypothetical protein
MRKIIFWISNPHPKISPTPDQKLSTMLGERYQVCNVRDVKPSRFIAAYAHHLKKANWLKLPAWVDLVKTGPGKQMCPQNPDWYYIRAGIILDSSSS